MSTNYINFNDLKEVHLNHLKDVKGDRDQLHGHGKRLGIFILMAALIAMSQAQVEIEQGVAEGAMKSADRSKDASEAANKMLDKYMEEYDEHTNPHGKPKGSSGSDYSSKISLWQTYMNQTKQKWQTVQNELQSVVESYSQEMAALPNTMQQGVQVMGSLANSNNFFSNLIEQGV